MILEFFRFKDSCPILSYVSCVLSFYSYDEVIELGYSDKERVFDVLRYVNVSGIAFLGCKELLINKYTSQVLDKLHKDHINFQNLLVFLEKQLQQFERCEHADLEAVFDAVRYMKEYPDNIHHPLEDEIFKYYLTHYKHDHALFENLLNEHSTMPDLTEKLLRLLNATLMSVPQDRKLLCDCLKKYIATQRNHMNLEEGNVYPILNSSLMDHDWVKIRKIFNGKSDPMFGKQVEKSYIGLLSKVVAPQS